MSERPDYFQRFSKAEVAKFTEAEYHLYSRSLMNSIGMREIAVKPREKKRKVGFLEGRQEARDQRDTELVINTFKASRSAKEIPNFLGPSEAHVAYTIAEFERAKSLIYSGFIMIRRAIAAENVVGSNLLAHMPM